MAFKSVELTEEDLKSGFRAFEKFNAIGDNHLAIWCRTEKQKKKFRADEPEKDVNVHILWRPAKGDRPAEEFEITGSWGLDLAIEKAKRPVEDDGLGLKDDSGHLVRITWTKNLPTTKGEARLFKVDANTAYPTEPNAKLPPGLKGGTKNAPPPEDDVPF